MLNSLNRLTDVFLTRLRYFFDFLTNLVDRQIEKIGPQGYYLYGILSNTTFFLGNLVIKLYPHIDWSICMLIRGIATFIFSNLVAMAYKKSVLFSGDEIKYVILRNFPITIQQLIFYFSISVIPLNITWIINNAGPIFVFIIAYFMLGQQIKPRDVAFLALSLIGINVVTSPQVVIQLLSYIFPIDANEVVGEMNAFQMIVALVSFLSLGLWAFGIVVIRLCKNASSLAVNVSLGVHMMAFGAIALIYRSDHITMPSISDLLFVFVFLAIPVYLSQILFIHGTIIAKDQGKFSLTNYIPVFYSYIYQIIFESRIPQLLEIFGIFLTFYGLYKVVVKPNPTKEDDMRASILTDKEMIEDINLSVKKDEEMKIVSKS
ncbi:integral membrane protein DUF6 containing protein (macronuclear) [Tetrahymena thermophila SB210]|uniref:Integral membrane protein DUF6 containing protein n=1 Tax=Tetrahymena thermophila (strain SB210) TaxID=312017 RepID=I7MHW6_TETTS|nr:integral membrane protein DUF6 containing protein [Tetrahymena thermophila SB210]EAR89946.1 integral membrane protein DUF6 containing protein [Tetrahymena thermophila SB210]|eukprot:XP_001010191.1 integral membrane protein DUF6 containing protein [Tetrahymena thermophila SB210]